MGQETVILISSNIMIKNTIRNVTEEHGALLYDGSDMRSVKKSIDFKSKLIILDLEADDQSLDNGLIALRTAKSNHSNIPVIVVSSISKKETITRFILEGVSDYILKPFDPRLLKEKIGSYLGAEKENSIYEDLELRFSLGSHLTHEIYKAKKGKYKFSLYRLIYLTESLDSSIFSNSELYQLSEKLFSEVKNLFWETDVYIQSNLWSHFGFFPFCDTENTRFIENKVEAKISQLIQSDSRLAKLNYQVDFATYPDHGEKVDDLLQVLLGTQ